MIVFAAIAVGLVGWPIYNFLRVPKQSERLVVDLKAMGNFVMPDDGTIDDVPLIYRALDGKRVELEGFMYCPIDVGARGTEFQLVYDVRKSYGGPPLVQERIYAHVPKGSLVQLYDSYTAARVVGILHVNVEKANGKIVKVYCMDVQESERL